MLKKKIATLYKVEGMHCGHCAASVENAIKALDGVKSAKADFNTGTVTVVSTKDLDRASVADAVKNAGFTLSE